MIFLVQTRHDGAHCPGYHPELLPVWVEALKKRNETAQQLGVKLHSFYSALPEHMEVAIVEADTPAQIAALITQLLPSEQSEIKVTPLTSVDELLALAQQMSRS